MERDRLLVRAVLCVLWWWCYSCNASPTLIPPDFREPLEGEGEGGLGYLLTMPQSLQAGSEEKYCLTLHGVDQDTTVTLHLYNDESEESVTSVHTYVDGQSQCNTIQVPNVPGRYEVNLQNDEGTFASSEVTVLGNNLITFVQTDKPIYKPGQKVKFRILTMLRNLRSLVGQIESVFIKDPNDFKVKRYANVESRGMATLEFQLIDEAKLGTWTIEVTVDGTMTTQTFKVEEYVLPRFEVTVNPPPFFLVSSDTFNGSVCAKYTYGKPVVGLLQLQVCPTGHGSFGSPCVRQQAEIDGCHDFSFNTSELLSGRRYFYSSRFSIDASVTEGGTGVVVNGSAPSPTISFDPLKMEFLDDTNGYFKPGMPVFGRVKVSKLDGTPAANEEVLVSASDHQNEVYMDKTFTTNEMGVIDYSLCYGLLDNTSSLSMFAEALNYKEDPDVPYERRRTYTPRAHSTFRQWFSPSLSYIQIPARRDPLKCGETLDLNVPFTHNGLKPYVTFYYQVMSRGRIVQAGTKDAVTIPDPLSFLDVGADICLEVKERPTPPPRPTLVPDIFPVNASEVADGGPEIEGGILVNPPVFEAPPEPEIQPVRIQPLSEMVGEDVRRKRSIMPPYGPGEEEPIVRSEDISDQVSNIEVNIPVTSDMSPTFSVLLYYIREDGETVADSMEFKVEPCFENDVKMEFSEKKVMPGAETTIHLEASSGSVCGVGVVDKSVTILGGDHQITPAKVFEKLAEYSLSTRGGYRYSYFRSDSAYCRERLGDKEEEEGPAGPPGPEGEPPQPWEYSYRSYSSNYVDAIQAFKQMGMLVLTNLDVETRPCSWAHPVYLDRMLGAPMPLGGIPGPGGPVMRQMAVPVRTSATRVLEPEEGKTRSNFPETWLWDLQMIGEDGKLDYPVTAPHTITQWVGNSMCISEEAGFGLSPVTSLTTFQPFFLAFNLPYHAVREERMPITVTVYNYLDKCLNMMVMVDGKKGFKVHGKSHQEPFCLCGGKSRAIRVYITAQDIGKLPIFATAKVVAGNCGNEGRMMDQEYLDMTDSVERKVLVKAEGVTQRYSHSLYICPKDGERHSEDFRLPLPDDIVSDSARGDVTVIGDIMGPALTNLDHLVRMPTGCGEQNMVGFTPNIYVLKYLTATGRLTEEMEDKATNFMEIGYQRELKYRHPDGSFSAFGPSDNKPGSTWLTAFVVKSFAQAKPYIFIDNEDLELSKDYLKSVQNPEEGPTNGCFFESGSVFSSYMQGGLGKESNDAALSAYVLIALLQAGMEKEDPVAVSGLGCINRQSENYAEIDAYTMALVAYANALYDPSSPVTADVMRALDSKATIEGDLKYWKRAGELPKPVNSWYYYAAPSAEVEMTSYALLARLTFDPEDVGSSQSIVYWLSKQRNAFGGYSSTQDTVLGLNALSEFAGKIFTDQPTNMTVMLDNGGGGMQADFRINDDNSLILQRQAFSVEGDMNMRLVASGTGCALVQANVHYNKLPSRLGIDDPKFTLRADPRNFQHDRNRCDRRTIYITFGLRSRGEFSSGMTMLTVRMVTGWSVIPESLRTLRSKYPMLGIEREEVDEEQGVVNFYLDELDLRTRRFALDVEQDRNMLIRGTKPAEVQIYQYYEKDVTVIKSYTLRTTCGTKEEIPYDLPHDESVIEQRRVPVNFAQPRRNSSSNAGPPKPAEGRSREARTTPPPRGNCPVCNLMKAPANYKEIVCNSTAVFKGHAGRNRKFSLKIKANLRPRRKQRDLKWFANIRMAPGCSCPVLDPPQKTVIIITQKENLDMRRKILTVDSRTYVFNVRRDRSLEKEARKAQRHCRMD